MFIHLHLYITKAYHKLLRRDIVRFVVVGGIGFVVNYCVLALLISAFKAPTFVSQIIATEIALLATFVGNNYWAFKGHAHVPVLHKLLKFHMSAGVGLIINVAAQALLVKYAHLHYGLALVGGTIAGLAWNYTLNKRFVFKALTTDEQS